MQIRKKILNEKVKEERAEKGQKYFDLYSKGKVNGMSVRVGSARSNENGGINGGAAGDQTGREVSTQAWHLHSKGWVVLRAKDATVREKIAHNMESICANDNIGYCQDHRATLTSAAKAYGYDASKVTQKVEVDCSEAVRNCALYAGITVGSFSTATEASALMATGAFDKLTDSKYCNSSDYLLRGDILVTKTKGHTVVALDNGAKAGGGSPASGSATASAGTSGATSAKIDAAKSKDSSLAGTYKVIASNYLSLRAGAGTSKTELARLKPNEKVKCYGYYTAVSGIKWLLVVANGITGFCSSAYLQRV